MTAKTVGFAIADEDRATLDALVDHFADGNRSEFLRVAMKRLSREMLAERMHQLQTDARADMDGRALTRDEVRRLARDV